MVSEKTIVVLLIVAIVLSVFSIGLTLSLNLSQIKIPGNTHDAGSAKVSLEIVPTPTAPSGGVNA